VFFLQKINFNPYGFVVPRNKKMWEFPAGPSRGISLRLVAMPSWDPPEPLRLQQVMKKWVFSVETATPQFFSMGKLMGTLGTSKNFSWRKN